MNSLYRLLVLTAALLSVAFSSDLQISCNDKNDLGSGAAKLTSTYTPGGLEKIGLFVGQPNELDRCDRILMRFPLLEVIKNDKKVKRVELVLVAEYLNDVENKEGSSDGRTLEIYKLNESFEVLGAEPLTTRNTTLVGTTVVLDSMQRKGIKKNPTKIVVDVTEAVLEEVSAGSTTMTFRIHDQNAETTGNSLRQSKGVVISGVGTYPPQLRVTLE